MKRWMLGLLLGVFAALWAQAPNQEVVLSASAGSKVGVALPTPQITGLDEGLVNRELREVVLRDLEEAGPFAVLRNSLPISTEISSYPAWIETGTDWLLICRVALAAASEVEVVLQVVDVKSGKSVFNKKYTGKAAAMRRMAHTISDDLVARLTGERGVATSRIVFVRQLSPGVKEIFQVDRDGANLLQLTNHKSLTLSPTIGLDGRIAYMTYKGGAPEIWGQMKGGGPHVKLYPRSGSPAGHCFAPSWSPDGKRLALVQGDRRGNSDIVVLELESGRVRRLTDSNCINTEPSWNPAGSQIAFTSDREGTPQVYLMEDDGSNVRRLTHEGSYNASPSWSPIGSMIAYVSRFEGKFDLFVFKLGEGKSYQVTTGVASSESPAWSPDERRLVFSSGSRGGMQLYTTDLSGNTLRRLTEFAGCQSPRWTRTR
jgi:TolB protein